MHASNPDHICALCDEFTLHGVAAESSAAGLGQCMVRAEQPRLAPIAAWSDNACISFRIDRPNLRQRRAFVEAQRRARDTNTENT